MPAADLPAIFADAGEPARPDDVQTALVEAALDAAALRPAADRSRLAGPSPSPSAGPGLATRSHASPRAGAGGALPRRHRASPRGSSPSCPTPRRSWRRSRAARRRYHADVTVQVRNGSGKVGVGEAVVRRLASLDVNLPAPLNADSFDYRQTQILAGPDTLPVAQDIRAILGRGVVLDGTDLPAGHHRGHRRRRLQAPQSSPKDQP